MADGSTGPFDRAADGRELVNPARRERPRAQRLAWNGTMPPIPADATVSLG